MVAVSDGVVRLTLANLLTAIQSYTGQIKSIYILLFSLGVVSLLVALLFHWLPLVARIRHRIKTERQLVNIIPFDHILNDEVLFDSIMKLNI